MNTPKKTSTEEQKTARRLAQQAAAKLAPNPGANSYQAPAPVKNPEKPTIKEMWAAVEYLLERVQHMEAEMHVLARDVRHSKKK